MKVHIVLNSHLDPIWLWRRSQGIDEVINSARTACNLIDQFPQIRITRGEAWFYEIVEKCDPALFKRIRAHIDSGHWEVVGGWYVQPDCNFPEPAVFRKHGEICMKYFKEHLGVTVQTGYNVDTFGHAATLPDYYNEIGIRQYIMMRPRDFEKKLPARNFIWESPKGNRLQVFRIWAAYAFNAGMEHALWTNLRNCDKNLDVAMVTVGFGDHGGGPLVNEVKWLIEHQQYAPGVELEFSTPSRYFDAVRASKVKLPVVKDELQYHAIGCYAVVNRIKREMKSAASLLTQADNWEKRAPKLFEKGDAAKREEGWKKVLFSTFHDVLSGSSLKSAYDEIYDDLGAARSSARNQIELAIRKENTRLGDFPVQRLIFDNLSNEPWKGIYECEPWIAWERWNKKYQIALTTLEGKEMPLQRIPPESPMGALRIAFPLEVPANGRTILALPFRASTSKKGGVTLEKKHLLANGKAAVRLTKSGIASYAVDGVEFLASAPKLEAVVDGTDTWSHDVDRLDEAVADRFVMDANGWHTDFEGPLAAKLGAIFTAPEGSIRYEVRLNDGESEAEVKLRVKWAAKQKLLRLTLKPAFKVAARRDGIPGDVLGRPLSKQEFPMTDFMSVSSENGQTLAVVSKDLMSLAVRADGAIRFTLLRSPYYAYDWNVKIDPLAGFALTDQGETEFRFKLLGLKKFDLKAIRAAVRRLECDTVHFSETTKGFVNPYQLKGQENPNFKKDFFAEAKKRHWKV